MEMTRLIPLTALAVALLSGTAAVKGQGLRGSHRGLVL